MPPAGQPHEAAPIVSFPRAQVPPYRASARPSLAANDTAARSRRQNYYDWEGRSAAAGVARRPALPWRRWALLSGTALLLVAAGSLTAFLALSAPEEPAPLAAAPDAAATPVAARVEPQKLAATVESEGAAPADPLPPVRTAAAGAAATPAPVPSATPSAAAPVAGAVKVPPPDDERWGEDADDAPTVQIPDTAPIPSGPPRELAYARPEPNARRAVDKVVTSAFPPPERPQAAPAEPKAPPAAAAAPGTTRKAVVRTAVKLRAAPRNGAGVLGVVAANSTVDVLSCDIWCHVSVEGRQGYVYKGFVGGAGKTARASEAGQPAAAEGEKAEAGQAPARQAQAEKPAPVPALPEQGR